MGVELGSSIGAGISSVSAGVSPTLGSGPTVSLGSSFPEQAAATFANVAGLDSGPIGGWGKGLAAPEPVSFGSRNRSSSSFVEGLSMFNPTDQINLNSQAESILDQAARPQVFDTSIAAMVSMYGQPEAFSLFQPDAIKPETLDVLPVTKPDVAVQRNVIGPGIFPNTEPKVASLVDYGLMPDFQPAAKIDSEIYTQVATQLQTETRVQAQSSQTVTAPNVWEQVVGEVEITGIGIKQEQATALHVIDKKAAANRIIRILARALQIVAKSGVSQKIKGADLAVGLPTSDKQEIRGGEINSKDPNEKIPDNTWNATLEQLRGLVFDSIEQIRAKVPKVVFDNHPVIVAKEGDVASSKNIARSHYQQAVAEGVIQDYPELAEALLVA